MPSEWVAVASGVAGAVAGGFVGGVTPSVVGRLFGPRLEIDYAGDRDNVVTTVNTGSEGQTTEDIWVRARVRNRGRLRAKRCQVFLTSLCEVRADGTTSVVVKDSKVLQWAGGSRDPLDVPPGVEFYVDLLKLSKHLSGWGMLFNFFKHQHQQALERYSGTYQFHLMISGENAPLRRCTINAEYKQDWETFRAWQAPRPRFRQQKPPRPN